MTAARRNLLVLALVVGLIAASVAVIATKPTRLGLDLQGGVQLIYQGKPTPQQPEVTQEAIDRTLEIMRERVDSLGVAEPEIQRSGRDQLVVNLPAVKNADRAQRQVGTTAQLFFYDWERNVIGSDGRPDIGNTEVTGGARAGDADQGAGALSLYEAVKRASERPAQRDGDNTTNGQFYLFGQDKRLLAGPEETQRDLVSELPDERIPRGAETLRVEQGTVVIRAERPDGLPENAPDPDLFYVLNDDPELGGEDIRNPEQTFDERAGNQPVVSNEFSEKGRKAFQEVTRRLSQRGAEQIVLAPNKEEGLQHFAITLDNELISVPSIDPEELPDGIDGTTGAQISGGFTIQSAQDLANLLKIGALPIELELISRSQVSASLGQQALDQGLLAGVAGFGVVALFLLAFYRVLGVIAVVALGVYALYFFALIKLIPVTLTLPGIAGLILTLGVAADANIVIFERVKEEIRAGRSISAGIATGYKKGFSTIVDANVVTLLTAFILFILATAGVKGFAFTLGLGTIVSLFTAVLATQAILLSLRGTRLLNSKSALGAGDRGRGWTFDFMGASRWFFSLSGVILLIGGFAVADRGLNFGIDFDSGTRITTSLERPATVDQVRETLTGAGFDDAKVQAVTDADLGDNLFQISTATLDPETGVERVRTALDADFGTGQSLDKVESIGPTFGRTVANSALYAVIASLVVISAYMALRFQWKFAVPVLIALMHDLLITGGVYSLTGREVTTATVAALLTILGFSLYDTIIVFDRIRENVPRMPRAAFSQIVNRSMSEVLTRSLATSFCTLLPVLTLFLFGGETLKDFAFALIVGTASGTYSSVFIAAPVLTLWKEREAVYARRTERIKAEHGGKVPAYATAVGGQPVDVPVDDETRPGRRLTAPTDPAQGVSREEFDAMVRDLDVEPEPAPGPGRPPAPAGGRRARLAAEQGNGGGEGDEPGAKPAGKRPRNRSHGRPR